MKIICNYFFGGIFLKYRFGMRGAWHRKKKKDFILFGTAGMEPHSTMIKKNQ